MNSTANLDSFFRVCKRYVMMIILPELTSKLYMTTRISNNKFFLKLAQMRNQRPMGHNAHLNIQQWPTRKGFSVAMATNQTDHLTNSYGC